MTTGTRLSGYLVVEKPSGPSSMQITAQVRRRLGVRAGHGGTLDPLACGLLPIALGQATKTLPILMAAPKGYRFCVRWGEERTTHDAAGEVVTATGRVPTPAAIEMALEAFVGHKPQRPPRFSAVKHNGRRAYDLARRGQPVPLKPREVTLYAARCVGPPQGDISMFEILCGPGFYVRALARDLGRRLGVGAYVTTLRRTQVGPFVRGIELLNDTPVEVLMNALRPLGDVLGGLPRFPLSSAQARQVRHGQRLPAQVGDGTRIAVHGCVPVALVRIENGVLYPRRVFHEESL